MQHAKVRPSLLLISQTPMSEGLKASSGCEMGSRCGVLMGFKAGGLLGLGVDGAPALGMGVPLALEPNSFDSPKGAPVLGMGDWPAAGKELYIEHLKDDSFRPLLMQDAQEDTRCWHCR